MINLEKKNNRSELFKGRFVAFSMLRKSTDEMVSAPRSFFYDKKQKRVQKGVAPTYFNEDGERKKRK